MEENKSIDRSEVQKNLYNALVKAYNTDKDIISTYGDVVTMSRGHGDEDKDEEPPTGSNRGTKRKRSGKEAESTNKPTHKERRITSFLETKAADYGQIKWIEDRIPRSMWSTVPVVYDKHAYWGTYHWGLKRQRFYGYATNMETSKDVYSKHRIIIVISLKIMKFYGHSHLEEITIRRRDDKLYKFQKGEFKRLRCQDIEDMLLLLVQGKLTNLKHAEFDEFDTHGLERFDNSAGHPVKEILLKLNLPDHRNYIKDGSSWTHKIHSQCSYLSDNLKNFEKDASLQLSSYQIKKGMSMSDPKSQVSQDGKDYKMAKRDYAWLMIS
ncbi:hypothetical protein Tco_0472910 [Tanacetum coccineum]